jgi:chorismate synthase
MLRFLTAGESHGRGLVAIIDGMVAGLPLGRADIQKDLLRRRKGFGRGARMALEKDQVEILSGVRHGLTLGSPISLLIPNQEWQAWQKIMGVEPPAEPVEPLTHPRPGHADLPGYLKYGFKDIRPVLERASARETASRVALGAIARRFLGEFGMNIRSHTVAVAGVTAKKLSWRRVEASPLRCGDAEAEKSMLQAIKEALAQGDTLGGIFEVVASGVPVGLGSYVQWDRRLDAQIAGAVMSIPSVKGVEIGQGFEGAGMRGSQLHDIILPGSLRRRTNRAGGIEGGVSNGEDIVVRAGLKPLSTLGHPLPSVDLGTGKEAPAHFERSDVCVVPAGGVVGEAVLALVLAQAFLEKFGGDSLEETQRNLSAYMSSLPGELGTA